MAYEISRDMLGDIAQMRNDGLSWAEIAQQYGVAPSTIQRAYLRKSAEVYR